MGNEVFLYASAGGHDLVARISPQPLPAPDRAIRLSIDVSRIHCFDQSSGERLATG
jgi:multiple sugar transport system ATP-binding protein